MVITQNLASLISRAKSVKIDGSQITVAIDDAVIIVSSFAQPIAVSLNTGGSVFQVRDALDYQFSMTVIL